MITWILNKQTKKTSVTKKKKQCVNMEIKEENKNMLRQLTMKTQP